MAKAKLGFMALSRKAARRRLWSKVTSGRTEMIRVPRACALAQSGEKKGKLRKGCKLTKNGAYCDRFQKLPAEAKTGPKRRHKNEQGRIVHSRRTVKCK